MVRSINIASVEWPGRDGLSIGNIIGYVQFKNIPSTKKVEVDINLAGLKPNTPHAIHIHEGCFKNEDDLQKGCMGLGPHFNPYNRLHGSIYNQNPELRHAGDLCNNILADENGNVRVIFEDDLISLNHNSPAYIVNRSLVIHEGVDDLGRAGRWLYKRGFVNYSSMTPEEIELVSGKKYSKKVVGDLIIETSTTGNAGGRMACGNIVINY